MLSMINELIRHKWWANANLLHAIEQHPVAAADDELRKMFHHILFSRSKETARLESEWLSKINESDLERRLETRSSRLGIDVSVRQAIVQICMHSHGHRAQCATRLRTLGGTPPGTDYVLWIKNQSTPS